MSDYIYIRSSTWILCLSPRLFVILYKHLSIALNQATGRKCIISDDKSNVLFIKCMCIATADTTLSMESLLKTRGMFHTNFLKAKEQELLIFRRRSSISQNWKTAQLFYYTY